MPLNLVLKSIRTLRENKYHWLIFQLARCWIRTLLLILPHLFITIPLCYGCSCAFTSSNPGFSLQMFVIIKPKLIHISQINFLGAVKIVFFMIVKEGILGGSQAELLLLWILLLWKLWSFILQVNKSVCHLLIDVNKSHRTSGSETRAFLTHGIKDSIISAYLFHFSLLHKMTWMDTDAYVCSQKKHPKLWELRSLKIVSN